MANDPASDWRHVESLDGLVSNVYEGCNTLGDIWDKTASEFEDAPCMGTRSLLNGEEFQKDGKSFMHLEFGKYEFKTFEEVDDDISSVIAWFNETGLKKGDHVVIFAETRPEWMQTAIACFKYGLPGNLSFKI